jgi:hypothetical protein
MVFWVVKACILIDGNHRRRVTRCLHLECWERKTSYLKMEAAYPSDTLIFSRNTSRRCCPEDRRVNTHCH